MCVSVDKISQDIKSIQPINFIFGGSLSCDPRKKPLDFEKNRPGVRVALRGSKFGPNDKRYEKNFQEAITPKRCQVPFRHD